MSLIVFATAVLGFAHHPIPMLAVRTHAPVASRQSEVSMGILDAYPGLQKKTRTTFSVATFALAGAFCAELVALTPGIVTGSAAGKATPIAGAAVGSVVRSVYGIGRRQAARHKQIARGASVAPKSSEHPAPPSRSSEVARLRGVALKLERTAHEMALEMETRIAITKQRKEHGLSAAHAALESAQRWNEELNERSGDADIAALRPIAQAELEDAQARIARLNDSVKADSALILEMDARVKGARAQAAEARVQALAAQPGYFVGTDAVPKDAEPVASAHSEDVATLLDAIE